MYKLNNYIIDLLTGFDIKGELAKVLEMDKWTKQMIEESQKEKFRKLSRIAGNAQYYRNYQGKELHEYPIMYREEFKKNHEFLKTNIIKPYSIQHSSGSTGYPVQLYITKEMLLAKRVSHQKILQWYGLRRESPEFKMGGIKENYISKIYYFLRNKKFINSFNITPGNIESIMNEYNRFKPSILYGYPSAIYNFLMYAELRGRKLYQPSIIITHAENVYSEHREKFSSTFPGTKIVNQYWATEANIAAMCPEGNLHIDEDTVICELTNTNEEGVGDLLITNLYSFALPIIRYKVGDRVRFSNDECPCGRKTKVIECIEGREIDYLELPDQRKIPVTAIYLSRYSDNVLGYQLAYYKSQETLEFRYIPINKEKPVESHKIAEHIKNDYGLSTRFVMIDEILHTKGGKFKKLLIFENYNQLS